MSLTTTSSVSGGGMIPVATRPAHSDITSGAGESRTASARSGAAAAGRITTIAELAAPELPRSAAHALVPAGTDPDLWRALSPDERAFFAHTPRSDAPVYDRRLGAPSAASAPPQLRRGLHLDLRA